MKDWPGKVRSEIREGGVLVTVNIFGAEHALLLDADAAEAHATHVQALVARLRVPAEMLMDRATPNDPGAAAHAVDRSIQGARQV